MYDGCQKMRNFGPEVQMLYLELQGLYTSLKILMRRPFGDLECRFSSADLEGRFDSASEEMKNVIGILTLLQTHFTVCNGIIEGVLSEFASPLARDQIIRLTCDQFQKMPTSGTTMLALSIRYKDQHM
jgi:hypothetical protein